MTATEIITSIVMFIGIFFTVSSAVGIIRMPDVYSRVSVAGKSTTFGVAFVVLAVFIYFIPKGIFEFRLLLTIVFLFLAAPMSGLMIDRSAHRRGVPLEETHVVDDLRDAYSETKED